MSDIPESRRGEGVSIATMWAQMVQAAEAGEVVAVANKHGQDVAVMVSIEMFHELTGIDLRADGGATEAPDPPVV